MQVQDPASAQAGQGGTFQFRDKRKSTAAQVQLRDLIQRRAVAQPPPWQPEKGVIQAVFTFKKEVIDTKEKAQKLAQKLFVQIKNPVISLKDFTAALEHMAENGDHGELEESYFGKLLTEGIHRESFRFEKNEKDPRIDSFHNPQANFPPQRSQFHQRLSQKDASPDLSYGDLRTILENMLERRVTQQEIDQAIETALQNFQPDEQQVPLDHNQHLDTQLLTHHLLRYQAFNHPQLKSQQQGSDENQFRRFAQQLSQEMIRRASSRMKELLVPRQPDHDKGGTLRDAMPGLLDLNRPLDNSPFDGETYKGVYKLMQLLLRKAWDKSRGQHKKWSSMKPSQQIEQVRRRMNPSFLETLPEMEDSTIKKGKEREYVSGALGFKLVPLKDEDDGYESFDEDEKMKDMDMGKNKMVIDPEKNVLENYKKRKTVLGGLGLFSKMTAQKEILDGNDPKHLSRRERVRQGIDQRTSSLKTHSPMFNAVTREYKYYQDKRGDISSREEKLMHEIQVITDLLSQKQLTGIKDMLRSIPEGSPIFASVTKFLKSTKSMRANTKAFKNAFITYRQEVYKQRQILLIRISHLFKQRRNAARLRGDLDHFYQNTSLQGLVNRNQRSSQWKSSEKGVFSHLGPQAMHSYLQQQHPDRVIANGRTYAPNQRGIRDGGECFWDTLRVRYGFSEQDLQYAAGQAGAVYNAHMYVDQINAFLSHLATRTGRRLILHMEYINIMTLQPIRTRDFQQGNGQNTLDLYIGFFVDEGSGNGHFVPPTG